MADDVYGPAGHGHRFLSRPPSVIVHRFGQNAITHTAKTSSSSPIAIWISPNCGELVSTNQLATMAATASNARARKVIIEASPPLLSSHTIARRLLFPIGPHVDVATTRAALGAHRLARKRRDLSVVREFRHVDQPRVPARRTVARQGDACCRASSDRRVVLHSITLSARARSVG